MKLGEYLNHLNTLVQEKPEVLDYTVIYSSDDEGNNFQTVTYKPDLGNFDSDNNYNGEFTTEDQVEEGQIINAICIN